MRFILQIEIPALEEDRTDEMSLQVVHALENDELAERMAAFVKLETDGILGDDLEILGVGRIGPLQ